METPGGPQGRSGNGERVPSEAVRVEGARVGVYVRPVRLPARRALLMVDLQASCDLVLWVVLSSMHVGCGEYWVQADVRKYQWLRVRSRPCGMTAEPELVTKFVFGPIAGGGPAARGE